MLDKSNMKPGIDYIAYQDIDFIVYINADIDRVMIKVHKKVGFNCVEEKPLAYLLGENALILRR